MKKYNIDNYVRYKEDIKRSMPDGKFFDEYTRDELITKFMPLVENLARKFATTQQASGVLSINDLIQEGNSGLIKAVDRIDWIALNDVSQEGIGFNVDYNKITMLSSEGKKVKFEYSTKEVLASNMLDLIIK